MSGETTVEAPSAASPAQDESSPTRPLTSEDSKPADSMPGPAKEVSNGQAEQAEGTTQEDKANGDTGSNDHNEEKPAADDKPASSDANADLGDDAEAVDEPSIPDKPEAETGANKKKRKSSTAVPEHKFKKLNKKKSQVLTHLDALPGEFYFARLKGFSPWPSVICDEEMLPQSLLNIRPVTTKQPDGTYRPPYAEGGKRILERTFPIMFLQTNEFAWMPNTDLQTLDPEACKTTTEKGKSKDLYAAYQVAAEQHELQFFKDMLADHQAAMLEDPEAKTTKSKKGKRKSKDAVEDAEDVDMEDADDGMDVDDDEVETKAKGSKKRKKATDSDGEAAKPAKTPKRSDSTKKPATKLKLTTPKTPNGTSTNKVKSGSSAKASKSKSASGKKSASKVKDDSDEDMDSPKVEEKPLTAQQIKEKKEKEVLYLRHKLQKGFLTRDQVPKAEEMDAMSGYITKLETYADLEVSIIRVTKINKVLKAIIKLPSIPRDEEFGFKKRSHDLLATWNKILASEPETPTAGPAADKEEAITNGTNKDEKEVVEEKAEQTKKETSPAVAAKPSDPAPPVDESEAEAKAEHGAGGEKPVESKPAADDGKTSESDADHAPEHESKPDPKIATEGANAEDETAA
ncbi:MAG: hypothetical protein M1835_004425 [Candelina submexicana]|nr:MAG: hypothetical protein M1835_004425 [Candelina submexicana]